MVKKCKNCQSSFEGTFCPSCGQKAIDQFSWRLIGGDILDAIAFNKGFLFNLKEFTIRPGTALMNYLNGATRPYMNPVAYNLAGISLLFLSIQLLTKGKQPDLFSKAELFVYGFTLFFPVLFTLVLLGAGLFRREHSVLTGLICSLFLCGNLLCLLVISRLCLALLNLLFPVSTLLFLLTFLAVATGYAVTMSSGYLGFGVGKTMIRLVLSFTASIIVMFFILASVVPETTTAYVVKNESFGRDFGYEMGRVTVLLFSF